MTITQVLMDMSQQAPILLGFLILIAMSPVLLVCYGIDCWINGREARRFRKRFRSRR